MLEKIYSLLERLVIAVERLAGTPAQPVVQTPPAPPAPVPVVSPFGAALGAGTTTAAAPQQQAQAPQQGQTVTREQVGTALVALATSKGREPAVAVLAQFGATKMDDVKAEQYPAVLEAIKKAAA